MKRLMQRQKCQSYQKRYNQQKKQILIINQTQFRPVTARERKLIEKKKEIRQKLHQWTIDYQKFTKQNWQFYFSRIQQTKIKNLWFNDNEYKGILSNINQCVFSQLVILHLQNNKIDNIEILASINAPKLNRLDLSKNYIVNIKSLRKCDFSKLTWLCLNDNPITNFESLIQFHAPFLQKLECRRKPFYLLDEKVYVFLLLQSKQVKQIDCSTFNRIPQQELQKLILAKYPKIILQWSTI